MEELRIAQNDHVPTSVASLTAPPADLPPQNPGRGLFFVSWCGHAYMSSRSFAEVIAILESFVELSQFTVLEVKTSTWVE
jgi:hypothetical protein